MAEPIKLPIDLVRELAFDDPGTVMDGWTVVAREDTGRSRWGIRKRLIVKDESGQHYAAGYEVGATESQDYNSFDNCEDYKFTPVVVRKRMVEVTEYVKEGE